MLVKVDISNVESHAFFTGKVSITKVTFMRFDSLVGPSMSVQSSLASKGMSTLFTNMASDLFMNQFDVLTQSIIGYKSFSTGGTTEISDVVMY